MKDRTVIERLIAERALLDAATEEATRLLYPEYKPEDVKFDDWVAEATAYVENSIQIVADLVAVDPIYDPIKEAAAVLALAPDPAGFEKPE